MVTPALMIAISQWMSCFSEHDLERLAALPSRQECQLQACHWSWHKDYLEWLAKKYPRGGEAKWMRQCLRPMRFWELVELVKRQDLSADMRVTYLWELKEHYPRYWYGEEELPRLPLPLTYAFPYRPD